MACDLLLMILMRSSKQEESSPLLRPRSAVLRLHLPTYKVALDCSCPWSSVTRYSQEDERRIRSASIHLKLRHRFWRTFSRRRRRFILSCFFVCAFFQNGRELGLVVLSEKIVSFRHCPRRRGLGALLEAAGGGGVVMDGTRLSDLPTFTAAPFNQLAALQMEIAFVLFPLFCCWSTKKKGFEITKSFIFFCLPLVTGRVIWTVWVQMDHFY